MQEKRVRQPRVFSNQTARGIDEVRILNTGCLVSNIAINRLLHKSLCLQQEKNRVPEGFHKPGGWLIPGTETTCMHNLILHTAAHKTSYTAHRASFHLIQISFDSTGFWMSENHILRHVRSVTRDCHHYKGLLKPLLSFSFLTFQDNKFLSDSFSKTLQQLNHPQASVRMLSLCERSESLYSEWKVIEQGACLIFFTQYDSLCRL